MFKELHKELKKHFLDYLLLIIVGIFTIICLLLFRGERSVQFGFIIVYAIFYILWAMYHHLLNGSLRLKNMLEYILIALIIVLSIKIIIAP